MEGFQNEFFRALFNIIFRSKNWIFGYRFRLPRFHFEGIKTTHILSVKFYFETPTVDTYALLHRRNIFSVGTMSGYVDISA